jgi:hypothetical protein
MRRELYEVSPTLLTDLNGVPDQIRITVLLRHYRGLKR